MSEYQLPFRDARGFCNVFLSGIGGDGANMASKMLFKIGVSKYGLDGGYDAKYGSEKKGTPTDVSVRFCDLGTPVRESGTTRKPHILAAFHEKLIKPLDLGRGLQPGAFAIVNTTKEPDEIREMLQMVSGTVICVEATRIAAETNSRLNMPMISLVCDALGFPADVIKATITKQWPRAAEANLAAFDAAINGSKRKAFSDDGKYQYRPFVEPRGQVGYLNMLNGGAIDALTHNTSGRDNQLSGMGFVPEFDPESCSNCGICLTVCSDPGGLLWREQKMSGIDTTFCKGCMRCVEVCPDTKKGKALRMPEGSLV